MKKLLAVSIASASIAIGAIPVLAGPKTHLWDLKRDAPYWRNVSLKAECPGPDLVSLEVYDHGHSVYRTCVEPKTLIRLPNGDARARFIDVAMRERGGIYLMEYWSEYRVVNCINAEWMTSRGPWVHNNNAPNRVPLDIKPGWFVNSKDGTSDGYPKGFRALSTRGGGIQITRLDAKDIYLCPNFRTEVQQKPKARILPQA